jgi:hypothetical protein
MGAKGASMLAALRAVPGSIQPGLLKEAHHGRRT